MKATSSRFAELAMLCAIVLISLAALTVRLEAHASLLHNVRQIDALSLLALAGLFIGILGLILINLLSIRRMHRLTEAVRAVRASADPRSRITEMKSSKHRDLVAEINATLDTLQRVHEKLQNMNTDLESQVNARTVELEVGNRALAEDAARRLQIEHEAASRHRIYRTIHELSPSPILILSEHGAILEVNQAMCDTLGYTPSQMIGQGIGVFAHEEQQSDVGEHLARLREGQTLVHEVRNVRADGRDCFLELHERMIVLHDNSRRIACVATDITERKAHEEALRESDARLRALFSTMASGFAVHEVVVDAAGKPIDFRFLEVNPALATFIGKSREEIVGHLGSEVFTEMAAEWVLNLGMVAISRQPVNFPDLAEYRGRLLHLSAYSPAPGQFALIVTDRTNQKKTESQLVVHNAALEAVAIGVMMVDLSGTVTWANHNMSEMSGYTREELVGQNVHILNSDQHPPAFFNMVWATILAGRTWRGEMVSRRKDGSSLLQEVTVTPVLNEQGKPEHFISICQDISERRSLQQQLIQSQKMELVGQLAGGIAHDFNNLLQAITGFGHLLLESLPEDDPHRSDVLEIDRAANRATELTRKLLAFSRRQMIAPRPTDLNTLVDESQKILQRLIGSKIQMTLDLKPHLDHAQADPGQLEQVLVNLVINSRDAMPHGGRITIATSDIVLLKEDALIPNETRHGHFVVLSVTDTGHGMPKEVKERIFEPFFSTKSADKGTGLGLPVVYGIVQQHEGMIHVYSEPGQGTTVSIYLPLADDAGAAGGDAECSSNAEMPRGRAERILLVEDESGVRDFAISALRKYGYQPSAADSCATAKDLFNHAVEPFDLLFTDVVLPDQNGLELAEALLKKQPNLRVLFTSGYMDEKSRWPMIRDRGYPFLQKPYSLDRLLQALRNTLDSPPPA